MRITTLLLAAFLSVFSLSVHASSRLDSIKQNNELKVCIWPDYFTISYKNPRTQILEGIDIDMAKALAEHLNVKLTFIESSFAKLVPNMQNNACDIAMHGVGIRESRKPYMNFSDPHLISGIYAISMKSNPNISKWDDIDQPDNVIVVQKGTYMEPVMRDYLKKGELKVVDSFKAREQEVESGRADVFMTDFPYGRRMAELTKWARLLIPNEELAPTPYAYAIPKGDAVWLKAVNDFVALVKKDGRLAQSAAKHGLTPIVAK